MAFCTSLAEGKPVQVWRWGGYIPGLVSSAGGLTTRFLFEQNGAAIQAVQIFNTELCQFVGDFSSQEAVT